MEGQQGQRLVSHAEAHRFLRRFGYSREKVEEMLRELPDPIDLEHLKQVLSEHGITISSLMDRMGGSP